MSFRTRIGGCRLGVILCALLVSAVRGEANPPPVIKHQPVAVAVRGQPVTILATVTDDSGVVKTVTLFYSLSKDAAPFRTAMKSSGANLYYGTIPASMVGDAASLSYYVEAMDNLDTTAETPYHTIEIKEEVLSEAPSAAKPPAGKSAPPGGKEEPRKSNLLGISLIAGAAVAVVAGAWLAADKNKDDSSDSSSGNLVTAGNYSGTSTECLTLSGSTPSCTTRAIEIEIETDGKVRSSTLRAGYNLEATVAGNDFALVADLSLGSATGVTGQVYYNGTVTDDRIIGTITGSQQSSSGAGSYSGSFSATRK